MERVLRPSPVAGGIAERADDLHELHDRSRPSVRENDRQRVLVRGAHVDEMNANPVDLSPVLREGVHASLKVAPLILVAPVGNERLSLLEGDALRPVPDGFPLWQPRGCQSTLEIVQRFLQYMDLEGCYILRRRRKHDLRSRVSVPASTEYP